MSNGSGPFFLLYSSSDCDKAFTCDKNFSFEQGHEYQFIINLDGNLEQGWPPGGSDYHNDFPGDDTPIFGVSALAALESTSTDHNAT